MALDNPSIPHWCAKMGCEDEDRLTIDRQSRYVVLNRVRHVGLEVRCCCSFAAALQLDIV
jgi:hypothetical protein